MAKINFPSSPTNGQTFNQNGVYYTYDSTFGAWVTALVPKPLDNSRNTQIIFNDATYANGSNGMTFSKSANTAYLANVAVTQNVYANYFIGNGAALTGIVTDFSPAYNTANGAYNVANGAYTTANGGYNVANAAFGRANTALQNTSGTVFTGNFFVANSVGVGRSTTGYALDVVGTVNASALLINGAALSGGATVSDQTTSASTFYPVITTTTSGTMSVANVSTTKLYFVPSTGTLSATVFNSLSDITLKTDIEEINGIELINKINPIGFRWKENGTKSYGVIAQELEQVLPELVQTNEGLKSVSYTPMIAMLIDTVKKQEKRIEKLEQLLSNQK
jgi:hypothetical protein